METNVQALLTVEREVNSAVQHAQEEKTKRLRSVKHEANILINAFTKQQEQHYEKKVREVSSIIKTNRISCVDGAQN